jgi:hypothetical protein
LARFILASQVGSQGHPHALPNVSFSAFNHFQEHQKTQTEEPSWGERF